MLPSLCLDYQRILLVVVVAVTSKARGSSRAGASLHPSSLSSLQYGSDTSSLCFFSSVNWQSLRQAPMVMCVCPPAPSSLHSQGPPGLECGTRHRLCRHNLPWLQKLGIGLVGLGYAFRSKESDSSRTGGLGLRLDTRGWTCWLPLLTWAQGLRSDPQVPAQPHLPRPAGRTWVTFSVTFWVRSTTL